MNKYVLEIEILSDTLIGSGEGFSSIVDTDIVFDGTGIPYIPSKRVKGLLRDSAKKISELIKGTIIEYSLPNCDDLFGKPGMDISSPIKVSNLYIEDYQNNFNWLNYFTKSEKYKLFFSKDSIIDYFTSIRKSTTVDDKGVAKKHSLRTYRVLSKGHKFFGDIVISNDEEKDSFEYEKLLTLSCLNLKTMGTKRNRGLGEIKCTLKKSDNNLNKSVMEELCKN